MSLNPRFPLFIPSKSRADIAWTPRRLDLMGVPYRLIVERQQYEDYAANYPEDKLLILPESYQQEYDPLDDLGDTRPKGAGAARNFAWDTSIEEGYLWHWVIDDNILNFSYLSQNHHRVAGDGMIFAAMEDFCLRYTNLGMAGPEYAMFLPAREKRSRPFVLNTRIFSCNLIRNDTGLRWRGRMNEDLILSIDMLKAGWCTVKFLAFCQAKRGTQRFKGGYTEDFYAREGTLAKSQIAVRTHPDVVTLKWWAKRWHHQADWSPFQDMKLIRDPAWTPPPPGRYDTRTVPNPAYRKSLNPGAVAPAAARLEAPRQPGRRRQP